MAKNKTVVDEPDSDAAGKKAGKVSVTATDTKFLLAKKLLANLREDISALESVLLSDAEPADLEKLVKRQHVGGIELVSPAGDGRVVEGVFDGQHMVGSDGRQYLVPQNYASKSKLVEGDILKLTIQSSGGFIFKQIGPIERERIVGTLIQDENTQEWKAIADGKKFSVLPASVSYFKGNPNDSIVLLIPKSAPSKWAAVENIIHEE